MKGVFDIGSVNSSGRKLSIVNVIYFAIKAVVFMFLLLSLVSCTEHKSEDPIEVYRLWSGQAPPSDVNIIHGKYWQSAHWTKEYILYMELKASHRWRDEYIKQNRLIQSYDEWKNLPDTPFWFRPTKDYHIWKLPGPDQTSRVFEDIATGHMFVYEIQL